MASIWEDAQRYGGYVRDSARGGPALAEPAVEEEPPVAAAPAPAAAAGPALSEPTPAAGGEVAIAPEAAATFEESVEASKTAPEEEVNRMATVLDDVMGPQSYVDAFKELYDKIQPQKDIEEYKLTDRQKGLAIMDFGLRMMAHGQDSTFAGAVGKAGLETRAATEALKDREYQKELSKQKRDLAVTGSALDQYFKDRSDTELEWTDNGLMNINRTTSLAQPVRGAEGAPLQAGVTPGSGARPFAHEDKIRLLIEFGDYTEAEATEIVVASGLGDSEANALAEKLFDNMQPFDQMIVGGKTYKKKDLLNNPALRDDAIRELAYTFSARKGGRSLAVKPKSARATEEAVETARGDLGGDALNRKPIGEIL